MAKRKKRGKRKLSSKKGRLSSVKKLLKSEEFQDFLFRVIREIIKGLK